MKSTDGKPGLEVTDLMTPGRLFQGTTCRSVSNSSVWPVWDDSDANMSTLVAQKTLVMSVSGRSVLIPSTVLGSSGIIEMRFRSAAKVFSYGEFSYRGSPVHAKAYIGHLRFVPTRKH